ncbi:L,D-transpeptidase [Halobacillus fulvus]|nr:L,D-transpeptidase [Halobacillus fulvus]
MRMFTLVLLIVSSLLPPSIQDSAVIIVNKSSHEVALFSDGKKVFQAPAAVGKTEKLTPEGQFRVKVKAVNPYYRKKNIPGGDPRNPLGSRWIGFDAKGTDGRIYGIHGTNQPSSIGKSVSAGCIRLANQEVEKLYDLVSEGTEVVIVSSPKTMQELYEKWHQQKLQHWLMKKPGTAS